MRLGRAAQALLLCLALAWAGLAHAQVSIPPLSERVTDLTGTLTNEQVVALSKKLQAFENDKGSQIAVLLVPTTAPESVEQYSIRVVDQWKIGRKNVDDGALLIIAKDDRTVRIEVGYGLEGVLNDAACKRIVGDIIGPHFKNGDFYGGIDAGLDRMMENIGEESLPATERDSGKEDFDIGHFLPVIFILALFIGGILRLLLGRFPGAIVTGGLTGFLAWALAGTVTSVCFAAVLAFLFTLLGGGMFGIGGFRRGSGLGSGFGGFSGGGGGFGGGGASGRW